MRRESGAEMWFRGLTKWRREWEVVQVAERAFEVLIVRVLWAERGEL